MKLWQAAPKPTRPVIQRIESQQEKLRRLSGEVLHKYQAELTRELVDPDRLAAVYGAAFANADVRRQADVVVQMASQLLDAPNACVNIVTDDHQETIAAVSNGQTQVAQTLPLSESYCKHVVGTGGELLIRDAREHPLVCNTHLAKDGIITSYLGVPVASRDGIIVGVLCVYDSSYRDWDAADVVLLTQLSVVLTKALN